MGKRVTILFVSHSATLYGAERSLLSLITGLNDRNFRTLVLLPARGPLTEALEARNTGCVVMCFKGWLGKSIIDLRAPLRASMNFAAYFRALGKLRAHAIDLIYTNTLYSPMGGMLSLGLGVPHIWHIREFVHEDLGARFDFGTRVSMQFVDKTAARVICNSVAVRRKVDHYLPAEKLVVVYNGFRLGRHPEEVFSRSGLSPGSRLRLCVVGSVHEGKGQKDAVSALSVLLNQGVDAELSIVGAGDENYVKQLKALARDLGITERICWEGFLSDTQRVFSTSDIALVCSRSEAFGRVAVEAMSMGCPVVGTNSGGLPEILDDEVNGFLYESGNHEMLASQVLRLFKDRELYKLISKNAITSVHKRFQMERYVSEIESVIREVLPPSVCPVGAERE
jgi:glycosyltransferase involved in cell wall biosynthesis